MTQIGHHDDVYRSTPLEQKLGWFQNAPGLSAIEPARQFMSGAAALYTDSDAQVRATMRELGADWTGDAATNAGATLQRAADWSQDAGAGHAAGGETVEGYGRSFESLRGQVHWDDPWAWGWTDTASAAASVATLNPAPILGNLTADYFTTAQKNRTNDALAIAALNAHETQTRTAVDSFPSVPGTGIDVGTSPGANPGALPSLDSQPTAGAPPVGGAGAIPVGSPAGDAGTGSGPGRLDAGGAGGTGPSGVGAGSAGGSGPGGAGGGPGGVMPGGPGGVIPGGPGGVIPGVGAGGVIPGGTGVGGGPSRPEVGGGPTRPGVGGAKPGGVGAADPGGQIGGTDPGGRVGGASPGGGAGGVSGSDPRLRGGDAPSGLGAREGGPLRLPTGPPLPGDQAGRFGVGVGGGTPGGAQGSAAGGWRDVLARPPAEPGLISRGPTAGPEFAARLPSGAPIAGAAAEGTGMPFIGGMGVGAGAHSIEHRNTYWVRSTEPFDVPLPPHSEGVLHGGDA